MPPTWTVEISKGGPASRSGAADAAIEVRGPAVHATLAVEAKRALGPRDVDRLLGSVGRTLRALSPNIPILIVAPWLSARTRELLAADGVNYIDLTGNARVRLDNPALFIETEGAARDPSPGPRAKARVRGAKAGRLIRTLVDVSPPYGVRELADATNLAPGYVSRLLDALDDDALIERTKRGRVESTDVAGLLRRWAETYDVFKSNRAVMYLAPPGAARTLSVLAKSRVPGKVAVTGSFVAARLAPVAAPALLCIYGEDRKALVNALQLIPADQGANVVALEPSDAVVWQRTTEHDGITYVAPSQATIDCLTGNGRMPAEGEALLAWMLTDQKRWRLDALTDLGRIGGA